MKTKPVTSVNELKNAIAQLDVDLRKPETEETWDKIAKSLVALAEICNNGAYDYPQELVQHLRSLSVPIISSMLSERTRLSGAAIELVSTVAPGLGTHFEPLVSIFLPTLLALSGRTTKVFVTRAKACITTIIETTQLPCIIPHFLQHVKDKSNSMRLASAEGTLMCVNCLNPPDLEKDARIRDIEAVIKATATDSQAEIRQVGKKLFEAYKVLFPSRIEWWVTYLLNNTADRALESFTAPLTPTIKKYLDIKNANLRKQDPLPRLLPTLESKKLLSSSTSAAIGRGRPPTQKPPMHARSTSTSAVSDSAVSNGSERTDRREAKKLKTDMPPPAFIPIRTVRSHTDLARVKPDKLKPSAPSRQPPPPAAPADAPKTSRMASRGPPQRVPRTETTQSQAREQPKEATSQKSVPQRARPQPPTATAPNPQAAVRAAQSGGPSRALPAKPPARPVEKPAKADLSKAARDKPVPSTRELQPRSLTQPTLAQLSRTAAVAKDKPASGKPAARPLRTSKSVVTSSASSKTKPDISSKPKAGVRKLAAAEIPLPVSPEPTEGPRTEIEAESVQAEKIASRVPSPDLVLTPVHPSESRESLPTIAVPDEAQNKVPTVQTEEASDPNGSVPDTDEEESPTEQAVAEVDSTLDKPGTPVFSAAPKTPMQQTASGDIGALSAKTPISALLNSIQRGFIMSPSEPLSPPQSYIEHKMPAPHPLNASKGPFIFGKVDEEERTVLNNMENIMNAQI